MTYTKPRLVGLNHIALEVGDIEEALRFYGSIFEFELRGSHKDDAGGVVMAFIDLGDQFIALSRGRHQQSDRDRHFGLVVDDRSQVRYLAEKAGAKMLEGDFLDFLDPWGNRYRGCRIRRSSVHKIAGCLTCHGSEPYQNRKGVGGTSRKRSGLTLTLVRF